MSDFAGPPLLAPLIDLSVAIGGDVRLVQGAGGNVSVKGDGICWVKASGTRLADAADRPIFVPMDLAAVRPAVLTTELITPYVLVDKAAPGLRPSIETAMHVLLPHRYVVHVHSVGAIADGIVKTPSDTLESVALDATVLRIPYVKPGIDLARAVADALKAVDEHVTGRADMVLLLANHGLVIASDVLDRIKGLLDRVQRELVRRVPPAEAHGASSVDGYVALCPAGSLTADEAVVLTGGALTPDEAVYLGAVPFALQTGCDSTTPELEGASNLIHEDGSVSILAHLGPDERESAVSFVDVARLVRPGSVIVPIEDEDVAILLDWDQEKLRQAMKR